MPLALGILLVSAGSASASTVAADLVAHNLTADGQIVFDGNLLALTRHYGGVMASGGTSLGFLLQAEALRVETAESSASGELGPLAIAPTSPSGPNGTSYGVATVQDVAINVGYRFDVFPTTSQQILIHVESNCATFNPSNRDTREAEWQVAAPSEAIDSNVAQAVEWRECGQSAVQITGDFVLILWQINATLETDGKTIALPSGYSRSEALPDAVADSAYPTVSHVRQQYLYVTNGNLTIPQMDASPHWAYILNPTLTVDGQVTLQQAEGTINQGTTSHPIQTASLALKGDLTLNVKFDSKQQLRTDLTGQINEAQADGQPLSFTATRAPDGFPLWGVLGIVGAALAAPILVVPRILHRRREQRIAGGEVEDLVDDAEHLLDVAYEAQCSQRFNDLEQVTSQMLQLDANSGEAHFLRAAAHAGLGDLEAALRDHTLAHDLLHEDSDLQAENAYFAALACARAHQVAPPNRTSVLREEATRWFGKAVALKPSLLDDMAVFPELAACLANTPRADPPYWMQP